MNNRLQTILETVHQILEARGSVSGHPLSFATASGTDEPAPRGRKRGRKDRPVTDPKAYKSNTRLYGTFGVSTPARTRQGKETKQTGAYTSYLGPFSQPIPGTRYFPDDAVPLFGLAGRNV